ncbi:MAG: prenyltransferase/squalene oxidase repeat-containing protein, partial [Planctomycetota bacterium]
MNRQEWSRGFQVLALVALAFGLWSCAAVSARALEANAAEASSVQDPQPPAEAKPDNPAKPKLPKVEWSPVMSPDAVKKATDRGANFLIDNRRPDGGYGTYIDDVGITALVVQALATCPRAYREDDGPFISKAIEYLLGKQKENGGFYNAGQGLENYKTSVTLLALTALDEGRDPPRYTKSIEEAREYLMTLQSSEDNGYDSEKHKKAYGGIGYGSDRRPDLSNTQFAIEALRAAGISEDSDVFKRALGFLKRCQNAEGNDLFGEESGAKSTGDGGMMYSPGSTKAETVENPDGTVSYTSYGSMTYAG